MYFTKTTSCDYLIKLWSHRNWVSKIDSWELCLPCALTILMIDFMSLAWLIDVNILAEIMRAVIDIFLYTCKFRLCFKSAGWFCINMVKKSWDTYQLPLWFPLSMFIVLHKITFSAWPKSVNYLFLWEMLTGGHCWNYYPGTLSYSQVSATQLKRVYPYISSAGAQTSNQLHWVDLEAGHQNGAPCQKQKVALLIVQKTSLNSQ